MTDEWDLPARLLGVLDQLEFVAKEAAGYHTGSRFEGQPPAWVAHVGTWAPLNTIELIKAHRAIVEMYLTAAPPRVAGTFRDLDHASAMGRRTTLGNILLLLAGSYGIEVNDA